MENLNLPHPKQIAVAVPANLRSGKPEDARAPRPADWGPVRQSYAGLLEIEPRAIQVSPTGWYVVRAIAMVFDRYLHSDRQRERFSRII